MRVVLDTNILISAFLSDKGSPYKALDLWFEGEYELVTSEWQIEEFRKSTRYERIKERIETTLVGRFINLLREQSIIVSNLPALDVSSDPDDNPILATAVKGEAQYLVTGDKGDLLKLDKVQGVRILSVNDFVSLFE
jgi:uncharacterized protein